MAYLEAASGDEQQGITHNLAVRIPRHDGDVVSREGNKQEGG